MSAGQRRRPIVVGVDGSEPARRAVRWAAQEAARRGVPLRAVTAFQWPHDRALGQVELGASHREIMLDTARQELDDAARTAHRTTPDVEVERQLVVGYPIPVLVAEARLAQLVVVGDRGLGGVTGLLVGSVAAALAEHADCPVVLVRGGAESPDPSWPVVVGVDGSPTSEAALAFAYETAAARGVSLVAVHTWWDLLVDPALAPLLDWDAIEDDERRVLAERLSGWAEKHPDVQVQRIVERGHPARALVAQSLRAQLVVVGSRGRGSIASHLLGSVGHALLRRAHCPVAVVRPDSEAVG